MTHRARLLLGLAVLALLLTSGGAQADLLNPFGAYYDNVARAAAANDAYKVRDLLGTGGNPNDVDDKGHTGLQIAAMSGNLQIAALLLKAGAKLEMPDKLGNTPLHYAAERGQAEIAKLVLDLGAAVDPVNKNGATPLMIAAGRGDIEIVKALLAKGANPTKTDFTGRDALGWAGDSRRPMVIQALQRAASGKR